MAEVDAIKLVKFLQGLVKIAHRFGQDTYNRVHKLCGLLLEKRISIDAYSEQVSNLFRKPESKAKILTILQGFANPQRPHMEQPRGQKRKSRCDCEDLCMCEEFFEYNESSRHLA